MSRPSFHPCYSVFPDNTSVNLLSVIRNFGLPRKVLPGAIYRPCADPDMFYGYPDLVSALEKAKAGALAYIEQLIGQGEAGLPALLQYRVDHYEDLNINLVESSIRQVEEQVQTDPLFKWQPYRIKHTCS